MGGFSSFLVVFQKKSKKIRFGLGGMCLFGYLLNILPELMLKK